jgi:mediator of RNA polymerase II transcription subunit 27
MSFHVVRPNGSQLNAIVHVTLARILKAVLVFKGLVIEWVVIRGFNEEGSGDSEADVWWESNYLVFKRITDNANAAMLNFHSPVYPEFGLRSYLVRLVRTKLLEQGQIIFYHSITDLPPQLCFPVHRQVSIIIILL